MSHPCREWSWYSGLHKGNVVYVAPPQAWPPLDPLRWLREVYRLYEDARPQAKQAAIDRYSEPCKSWGSDCRFKMGSFALREIWPPEMVTEHLMGPGGAAVARSSLRAVIEWRVLVWCGPHGGPPPTTGVRENLVTEPQLESWGHMEELIHDNEAVAR